MLKPAVKPTVDTQHFWDGCRKGELRYQHCTVCNQPRFYPRGHCYVCGNATLEWRESSRIGTVHSFTTVFRAPSAAFKTDVPYLLALIDLEEKFRIMANVRGCSEGDMRIGAIVRIGFEKHQVNNEYLPQVWLL